MMYNSVYLVEDSNCLLPTFHFMLDWNNLETDLLNLEDFLKKGYDTIHYIGCIRDDSSPYLFSNDEEFISLTDFISIIQQHLIDMTINFIKEFKK